MACVVDCWPIRGMVNQLLMNDQFVVNKGYLIVGSWLSSGWLAVNSWSIDSHCWLTDGSLLVC